VAGDQEVEESNNGSEKIDNGKTPKILLSILRFGFIGLVLSTLAICVVGGAVFLYFSSDLPALFTLEDYKPRIVTTIRAKDGTVIGEHFEERRYVLPPDQIPELAVKAFVAAEDDRFFEHQGIDFHGILRAAIANFKAGRVVQGGSTITQQVAKSLLLTPERSFVRKFKELILANRMERNFNKKQILYLYLNQIYLGQGAYGIEAAARIYFNKNAKDLTLAESALLGGLPQAPSKYSPLQNPKSAKQRQLYVLRRMMESGAISVRQMEEASVQPVNLYYTQDYNLKYSPYYVEHVRKYLLEKYGKEKLYEEGLEVLSPIDARLAEVGTKAVRRGVRTVDRRLGYRGPIKKIKIRSEEASAIAEIQHFNLEKKFPYAVLVDEGVLSTDIKYYSAQLSKPADAFQEDELYQGLVVQVDDKKKEVLVDLGVTKGIILIEDMRWANPNRSGASAVEAINFPSQALSRGDVIWVSLLAKEMKDRPEYLSLALEQVPLVQGALISLDVRSGDVISMVGGYDFKESEFNRAIQAERQTGSAYKPIIYSAAIDKGYTPATIIQDSPIVFDAGENEKWKPDNYEEKFYGDTLFRSALIHSRNIPTIKIVQDIEVPYLVEYSIRLGLPDKFNRDLSIALGSSTASLLDLASVYAVFPRGGRKLRPIFITEVRDRDGNLLEENRSPPFIFPQSKNLSTTIPPVLVAGELETRRAAGGADAEVPAWTPDESDPDLVMDPRTAFVMTHLMNEVTTFGTGHAVKNLGRPAAGKTGTTNDYLDAWFMGFTPQIVTGVWVGFDTQKSLGGRSAGANTALPIWMDYMREATLDQPIEEFAVPNGVTFSFINTKTGKPTVANAPGSIREVFIEGTQPGLVRNTINSNNVGTNSDRAGDQIPSPPRTSGNEDFFKEDIE